MKVLYIVHSTVNGGATISFMNFVGGLINKGIIPIIITPQQRHKDFIQFLEKKNIRNYQIPMVDMLWPVIHDWRTVVKYPLLLFRLAYNNYHSQIALQKIIKVEKPDIIHTNVGVVHCGYKVARDVGIPHVWHLREYQDKDFGWKIFPSKKCFKKLLKESYVITITKDILNYFSLDSSPKALCIYNGILSYDNIKNIWPKEKYFISANNIVPAKSMETTIIGFAKFVKLQRDYKLKICGTGDENYILKLKQLAKDYYCENNIEWLGFVHNVPELLAHAKGLIVSSRNEGFGRMTAEACFMGCIPIGRNTAGTKEIIDYTGGFLFNNSDELADKLIFVSGLDQHDYMQIISKAQDRARKTYSIESNINSIFEVYKRALR